METYGFGQPPVKVMRVSGQNETGASSLNIAGPSTAPDPSTFVNRTQSAAARTVPKTAKPKPAVNEKLRLMDDLVKKLGHKSINDLSADAQQLIASIAGQNEDSSDSETGV